MCSKPYRQGVAEYGCGQCLPCRINKRRIWVTRLILESCYAEKTLFVTLTYADKYLPEGGSVSYEDAAGWIKRVRSRLAPSRIRYYLIGEYGDITYRPHYHAIVFGSFTGEHVVVSEQRKGKVCGCVFCESWGKGIVDVQEPGPEAYGYVASYTVKKMTGKDDPRLGGREPEFAIMSLKPGIGAEGAGAIARYYGSKGGAKVLGTVGDVSTVLRIAGKKWPLGRYLLGRIRREVGMVSDARPVGKRFRDDVDARSIYSMMLRLRQVALMEKGARELREQKREQAARRAHARFGLDRSKKGIGL